MSDQRVKKSLLFEHYEKLMDLRDERKNQKWISINLEDRKTKKE